MRWPEATPALAAMVEGVLAVVVAAVAHGRLEEEVLLLRFA